MMTDERLSEIEARTKNAARKDFTVRDICEFIPHAKQDILDLLAEIRRFQEDNAPKVSYYWDWAGNAYSNPKEILDDHEYGDVQEIDHVVVVKTTFEAHLPPATDSDSDDNFVVCCESRKEAENAVNYELLSRGQPTLY